LGKAQHSDGRRESLPKIKKFKTFLNENVFQNFSDFVTITFYFRSTITKVI